MAQAEVLTADDLPGDWNATPYQQPEYDGAIAEARQAFVRCIGVEGLTFTDFAQDVAHSDEFSSPDGSFISETVATDDVDQIESILATVGSDEGAACLNGAATQVMTTYLASDPSFAEATLDSVVVEPVTVANVGDRTVAFSFDTTLSAGAESLTSYGITALTQVGDKLMVLDVQSNGQPFDPTELDQILGVAASKVSG